MRKECLVECSKKHGSDDGNTMRGGSNADQRAAECPGKGK